MKGTKQLPATSGKSTGFIWAFTLIELLVVFCATGMLAAVLLSVAFTTRERVMRAQCADNLRQIGAGLNIYANEKNGYLPICGWKSGGNPWETYLACRFSAPGSTNIVEGYYNLGLLFRTKVVPDPRIFYCPSLAGISETFSYDYYATNGWPSVPVGYLGNPFIRVGYNYYPQLRATQQILYAASYFTVPKLTYSRVQLEFGSFLSLVTPAKWTELDSKKSITTDLVNTTNELSHLASGSVAGLNALFPDGRVTFQNARTDSRTGINSPWYNGFWMIPTIPGGPGDNPSAFRIIMSDWQP